MAGDCATTDGVRAARGCSNCAACPLLAACRAGKRPVAKRCAAPWWPVYVFYTLMAFCVIRYGFTALSESMHLRPDYDANVYHIIGRGWMEGVLPYVGLSDLKGPLVFLQCGLGSLLAPDSFLGVSIVHAMVVGLGLLYACKSAALFVGRQAGMAIGGILFVYTLYFSVHPSVTVLTLQYISFYAVLRYAVQGGGYSGWQAYACGVFAGVALLLKFNLVVFWLPVGVTMLVCGHGWRRLAEMLAGFATVMVPAVVYMGCVGMLAACWQEYVLTAVEYGSVGVEQSAIVQRGWRLLAQVVPDHLYLAAPEWICAIAGALLILPWLVLPRLVSLRHPGVYYGVMGGCFVLGVFALFGGEHHFLHYYFSFLPYVGLSLVAWVVLLRRMKIWRRFRYGVCGAGMLLPFAVVAVAVLLPRYVDACKPEKGLAESRQATAALVQLLQGQRFLCTEAAPCIYLYRLAKTTPPIRHFVPQMTPQGQMLHRQEMRHCLRVDKPRYVVCTARGVGDTEALIAESGTPYRRVELRPPHFPPYPATADYAPFCLYELR